MASSFSDFSAAKTAAAEAARITPLEMVKDRSIAFPVEQTGNPWSTRLFDGLFHVWEPRNPDESAVSLVFVLSRDGNTVTHDPATLGGGDTDQHLLYEGLTRVAADGVLSGAATAAGPGGPAGARLDCREARSRLRRNLLRAPRGKAEAPEQSLTSFFRF